MDGVDCVTEIAGKRGVSNAQVALAGCCTGLGDLADYRRDQAASSDRRRRGAGLKLTPEELKSLGEPYKPHPIPGHS